MCVEKLILRAYFVFCFSLCFAPTYAQQGPAKHSFGLRKALGRKDTIRLTPEAMELIRSGRLLNNPELFRRHLQRPAVKWPLSKHFDLRHSEADSLNIRLLPPALVLRYYNPDLHVLVWPNNLASFNTHGFRNVAMPPYTIISTDPLSPYGKGLHSGNDLPGGINILGIVGLIIQLINGQ
jgi:hypothetical protein